MTADQDNSRRVVTARRSLALGAAAALAGTTLPAAGPVAGDLVGRDVAPIAASVAAGDEARPLLVTGAEGGEGGEGGEGEGKVLDADTALMRDLGSMEGHLRAGMALYRAGDVDAARTHMGHPIKEKYAAVADAVEAGGQGRLKGEIEALADAAEAGAAQADLEPLLDAVHATLEEIRGARSVPVRMAGLIALTRIAGDEYSAALDGERIADLHEYQDSWGFLQVVGTQLDAMAQGADEGIAAVARRMRDSLAGTDAIYGDLQGAGDFEKSPSVIFGAAARMELAAARLK